MSPVTKGRTKTDGQNVVIYFACIVVGGLFVQFGKAGIQRWWWCSTEPFGAGARKSGVIRTIFIRMFYMAAFGLLLVFASVFIGTLHLHMRRCQDQRCDMIMQLNTTLIITLLTTTLPHTRMNIAFVFGCFWLGVVVELLSTDPRLFFICLDLFVDWTDTQTLIIAGISTIIPLLACALLVFAIR